MVSSDNRDNPNKGGAARPQATLDLKAKTVGVSATEASRQATSKPTQASSASQGQPTSKPTAPLAQDKAGKDKAAAGGSNGAAKAEPRRPSRIGSMFTHLLASIFGGVVAVGVTYVAVDQFRDNIPILTDAGATALRTRIAGLEQRMDTLEFDNKTVASEVKTARNAPPPAPAPVSSPAPAPAPAVDPALKDRVAAASSLAEQTWSQLRGMEQRLAAVEGRAGKGDPALPPSVIEEGRLRAEIDPLKARVDALDKAIQGVSKWRTEQQHSQKVSAVSSALGNLRQAFDQGRPYEAELKAVLETSPVSLELSGLASRQSTGVESNARLAERFNKASKEALNAVGRSKGGSVFGEALSRVQSAVRVKPAGSESPDGQEPDAVIARMEMRVKAGDLAGAVREGHGLSDPAAAYFKSWLADAEVKVSGLDALNRAEAKLAAAVIEAERNARRGG